MAKASNVRTDFEKLADAEIERQAKAKAKAAQEKQRIIRRGVQLMEEIKDIEVQIRQEKVRINNQIQTGNFYEGERFIKVMEAALRNVKGVK